MDGRAKIGLDQNPKSWFLFSWWEEMKHMQILPLWIGIYNLLIPDFFHVLIFVSPSVWKNKNKQQPILRFISLVLKFAALEIWVLTFIHQGWENSFPDW